MQSKNSLFVDFTQGCPPFEIAQSYRRFARACVEEKVQRALVAAGQDDPPGAHYGLRNAMTTIVLTMGIPHDLKLALVPMNAAVEATFRTIERDFRILGIETRVFADTERANAWLVDTQGSRASSL